MADGNASTPDTSWRPSGRQIAIAVLIGIVVLFAVLNLDDAKVDFLVDSVKIPLVFVIAVTAILGFVSGFLFARHIDKSD